MKVLQERIGSHGEYSARMNLPPFTVVPDFPKAGEGKRASAFHLDSYRLFSGGSFSPLIETVCQYEASSFPEC